jgi:hypothetical protein
VLQAIVFVLIPAAGFLQAKKILALRAGWVEAARFSLALRACFLRNKIPFHARSSTRLRINSNRIQTHHPPGHRFATVSDARIPACVGATRIGVGSESTNLPMALSRMESYKFVEDT